MERRGYLVGLAAALAGCSHLDPRGQAAGGDPTASHAGEIALPVPTSDLQRGASSNAIPAIVDPVFGTDWEGVVVSAAVNRSGRRTPIRLHADELVVGINRYDPLDAPADAGPRAYPLRVLNWHEVVNDSVGDPLLVSYCPICRTAVAAERRVAGNRAVFGVSGLLYRDNLVMYDRATRSLWSQLAGLAIRGVRTGSRLTLVPAMVTTWGRWRETHPDTLVLRPPPESGTLVREGARDYSINPYADYQSTREAGYADYSFADERLHPKAEVLGLSHDGSAVAYPLQVMVDRGVVNDRVGQLPIVVAVDGQTLVAYDRRVGERTLTFDAAGDDVMAGGGSRWRIATGTAIDGPYRGTRLAPAADHPPMFWFAWLQFHPETEVYGQ